MQRSAQPGFLRTLLGALTLLGVTACGGGGDGPTAPAATTPIGGAPGNNAAFRVLSTTPDEDEASVDPQSTITVKFDSPVDSATATPNNIRIIHSATRHPVEGALNLADPQTLVFKPIVPFEYGAHYEGLVRHYVTSASGAHLPSSYRWEFSIAEPPLATSLHVAPADGKQNVNVASLVRVDFNTQMDAASVNPQSFTLTDPAGAAVPASVEFSREAQSAVLRPQASLTPATTYKVQLNESVKRASGQAIAPFAWSFTTSAQASQSLQLGGAEEDRYSGLVTDQAGNRIFVHSRMSIARPAEPPMSPSPIGPGPGVVPPPPPSGTVEVKKYSPQGARVWARELDATVELFGLEQAVDADGNIIAVGSAVSGSIPPGGSPPQGTGLSDLFVWKLSGVDGSVLWQAVFGTPDDDVLGGVAVDSAKDIYLTGMTVARAADPSAPSNEEGVVIKIAGGDGSEVWQTEFGSSKSDYPGGIAVDDAGTVFVAGTTDGVLGNGTNAGQTDVFLSRFSAADGSARGSTLTGTADAEQVHGLLRDANGLYVVGGVTTGNPESNVDAEGRVWAFNEAGTQTRWTQTIGGPALENIHFGILGNDNVLFVAGYRDVNFFDAPPEPPGPAVGVDPPLFLAALDIAADGAVLWNTEIRGEAEAARDHLIVGHAEITGLARNEANEPWLLITLHGPGAFDGLSSAGAADGYLLTFDPVSGKLR